jgi:hypothetical protein
LCMYVLTAGPGRDKDDRDNYKLATGLKYIHLRCIRQRFILMLGLKKMLGLPVGGRNKFPRADNPGICEIACAVYKPLGSVRSELTN